MDRVYPDWCKSGLEDYFSPPISIRSSNGENRNGSRFGVFCDAGYKASLSTKCRNPIRYTHRPHLAIGILKSFSRFRVQEVLQVQQSHIRPLAGECAPRSSEEILFHLSSFSFLFRGVQRGYFSFRKCTAWTEAQDENAIGVWNTMD